MTFIGVAPAITRALIALALAAMTACTDRSGSAATGEESVKTSPPSPDSAPVFSPDTLISIAWHPFTHPPSDTTDPGTGVVGMRLPRDKSRTYPLRDTLVFRSHPSIDSAIVGGFITDRPDMEARNFAVLVPAGVQLNVLTYEYGVGGIPTDSVDASGQWVRGILGFTSAKAPVRGWAMLDSGRTETRLWVDDAPRGIVSFLPRATPMIYPTFADGKAGTGGEAPPALRYEFEEILERREQWLRVRMRWPFDSCSDKRDGTETRDVWIRYLDDRGRPLAFYRTGTC